MTYNILQNLESKIRTFLWFQSSCLQLFCTMSCIDKLAGKPQSFNYVLGAKKHQKLTLG